MKICFKEWSMSGFWSSKRVSQRKTLKNRWMRKGLKTGKRNNMYTKKTNPKITILEILVYKYNQKEKKSSCVL